MSQEIVSIFIDGPQIRAISEGLKGRIISPRELLRVLLKGRTIQKASWYELLRAGHTPRAGWLYKNVRSERLFELITSDEDVDLNLATDLIEEGFIGKPDTIILVSGDGDFLKPFRIAKRQGIRMELAAANKPPHYASVALIREADLFTDLMEILPEITVERIEGETG